ncbi:MAG: FkbM family methyltransferase [Chloracidobacterium sp.]|nr:FkbM family methyltransferase [Chloracidobacterium sp.]
MTLDNTQPGFIHKLVRLYTLNSPLKRGRHRLSNLAFSLSPTMPREIVVKTIDGRELFIDTKNNSYKYVYFLGEYESVISNIFRRLINPDNICLDIGANIGWYTTLFQKLVGPAGQVHGFEPVPHIFTLLGRNVKLNVPPDNVMINNLALGNEEKDVELHVFADMPDGHSSISTFGHADYETFTSKMTTLDSYLSEHEIDNVSIVKMDVEGAELMALQGASKLFEQERLPIFEIEMALATSKGFGYIPNDLIEFIRSKASYDFYAIDETHFTLQKIDGFEPDDIGANVLCLPQNFDKRKVSDLFV